MRTSCRPSWSRVLVAAGALLVASVQAVSAQVAPDIPDPGEAVYEVTLTDGSTIIARVTAVQGDQVVFTTVGGARLEVAISQVRSVRSMDGQVVRGEYWRRDRSDTRLFFSATGRTLGRGEGYIGTYLIILPFVAVGVTDRFTLAAGAPITVGEFEPFYLAPKLQLVRADRVRVSVGVLHFIVDDENVGIAYGAGTFGTSDNALTGGLGFGYAGDDFSSQPVAMIGGEVRAGRKVKLLTENYFLPGETGAVFSFGFRIIGEHFSTDIGVAGAAGDGDVGCCVPMLNFSYGFGGN